jgi:hypothetical protein
MVEKSYENYLVQECKAQQDYKNRLRTLAQNEPIEEEKARKLKVADDFELGRCDELIDLFPDQYKRAPPTAR